VGEQVFVEEVGAEEGRVVGVEGDHEALFEIELDGVGVDGVATTGADVAGDIELEGDLALGENLDEVGVFPGGEGMADAFGADVDGGPDALGSSGFAGVAGEAEAGGLGFGIEVAEVLGGASGFVATDADADDAGIKVLEGGGLGEDAGALGNAEVADGVDDPEQGDIEVGFTAGAAAFDGGHDFVDVEAAEVVEDADGDVGFGVANALGGEVAEHVVGDGLVVGGGVEALGDGLEAHEEAGEVRVAVDGAGCGKGEGCGVVAEGELEESFGRDGAFEMEMELGFGEAAEPGFGVGLFGLGEGSGACHLSSVVNRGRGGCGGSGAEVASGADSDGRAFGEEDVVGGAGREGGEGWAVEGAEVGLTVGGVKRVDLPAGVGYAVLAGAAVAAFGVAPVVFGDELVEAVGGDGLRSRGGLDGDALPGSAVAPVVADVEGGGGGGPGVAGAGGGVSLAVEKTGG
jgi:hypothetical protein